ncbi:phage terminase large subunit family protein [Coraliomargarita sp. W4R72]
MANRLPDHAKNFRGRAKNIPERDTFLLPYQARWVNDHSLVRVMEKSRRVGISYATAYDEVRQKSIKGCKVDTWFSSRDDLTAQGFINYCKGFAGVLNIAANAYESAVLFNDGKDSATARVLRFATDCCINSISSNPDVFAGKGGNVGLDEFALRNDPRKVYDIAQPTIDWGGRLSIISTHRGAGNFFNKLIKDERDPDARKHRGLSIHRVTLTDALEQNFLWKLQTVLPESDPRMQMDEADYYDYLKRRASTLERFLQEYECQPEDESSVYLPYDLLQGSYYTTEDNLVAHTEETTDFRGKKGRIRYLLPKGVSPAGLHDYLKKLKANRGDLYHGKDVARRQDLSVDVIGEKRDGLTFVRAVIEFDRCAFSKQEQVLYPLMPLMSRSCVDETGIGMQFAERAGEKFGDWRVEGITFTPGNKQMLAPPVRTAFEDRSIRVPDDDKFETDLRMIQKETVGDKVRYVAEDEEGEADSHADRFWALALMLHSGKNTNASTHVGGASTAGGNSTNSRSNF